MKILLILIKKIKICNEKCYNFKISMLEMEMGGCMKPFVIMTLSCNKT